jgi:hypothetical protein
VRATTIIAPSDDDGPPGAAAACPPCSTSSSGPRAPTAGTRPWGTPCTRLPGGKGRRRTRRQKRCCTYEVAAAVRGGESGQVLLRGAEGRL